MFSAVAQVAREQPAALMIERPDKTRSSIC